MPLRKLNVFQHLSSGLQSLVLHWLGHLCSPALSALPVVDVAFQELSRTGEGCRDVLCLAGHSLLLPKLWCSVEKRAFG